MLITRIISRLMEKTRTLYNNIIYRLLSIIFHYSRNFSVFNGSNGYALTIKYKNYVYKFFNIFFLFHSNNSFKEFKKFHNYLKDSGIKNIPAFKVGTFYVRYEFIQDSQDLKQFLLNVGDSKKRYLLLKEIFMTINYFHNHNLIHNDLKPKNIILDKYGHFYFIDFEDSFVSVDKNDFLIDYEKLIPRIIYFFTKNEISRFLEDEFLSEDIKVYLKKYLLEIDIKKLLSSLSHIKYENEDFINKNDDIDIKILDYLQFKEIKFLIEKSKIDHFIFFHSSSDIKIYLYNLNEILLLDVHLHSSIGKLKFLYHKLIKNSPTQISVIGPDGVGKTTLIQNYIKNSKDGFLSQISFREIHISRFAKNYTFFSRRLFLIDRILNKLSLGLFRIFISYFRLIQTDTHPVILFDRSFYDDFLHEKSLDYYLVYFYRIFFPKKIKIILLHTNASIIMSRKNQLSINEIINYYQRVSLIVPVYVSLDAENYLYLKDKFEIILQYIILTRNFYLD